MSAIDALALMPTADAETALARPLSFSVPLIDNDEFSKLKPKRRLEVQQTLRVLERMHAMRTEPHYAAAVKQLARSYTHLKGFGASSLHRKYAAYVAAGDWRSLVKGYAPPSKQPEAFADFVRGLIEQNRGEVLAALQQLREEIWPSGTEVPGYGTWQDFFRAQWPQLDVPQHFPRVWPTGWSERNLRRYGPTQAEIKLFDGGLAAAHGNLPKIVRDTHKLRPMERIVIDDFQLDVMCKFTGVPEQGLKPQIAYVGGLMAMCVGTRRHLAKLFGPMIDREVEQKDGTTKVVRTSIKQIDVQALLYTVFRNNGIPQDYDVLIVCETRTATISPALEMMLRSLFGGRIRVSRTSLIEHKTLTNGFVETGGTPWEKGWIESDFNYLWKRLKRLPGYKGSNERLNAPGDLAAKLKLAAKFLGQGKGELNLPPEIVAELPLPFMNESELETAFDFVIDLAERRTNHRFNGFDTITDFYWPNPALPAPEGIDPVEANSFRALAVLTKQQQALMVNKERKESTVERWERLIAQHPPAAVSDRSLALFLLTPNAAKWRNHAVSFSRNKVAYSYVDVDGVLPPDLADGTELLAYVDFNAPAAAVISREDGNVLGVLRMLGDSSRGVDITDEAAVKAARAKRAEIVNRVLSRVRARPLHQATNAQLAADAQRRDEIVAAYQGETAHLPEAEQIATAIGAKRAEAEQQSKVVRTEESDFEAILKGAAGKSAANFVPKQTL